MRIDRWYWLLGFIIVSASLHGIVVNYSRTLGEAIPPPPPTEMEVTLAPPEAPLPEEKKTEPEKPKPEPKKPPAKKEGDTEKKLPKPVMKVAKNPDPSPAIKEPKIEPKKNEPTKPNADPGGIERLANETPVIAGLPSGVKNAGEPKIERKRLDANPGGGGAPAPDPNMSGKGGAKGPETPPDELLYAGGGAGGVNLAKAAPKIGGGGGRSILAVENPLAKDAIPEERPGIGAGLGGGQGLGAGGGVGFSKNKGIGTRLDGKEALAALRTKPGNGIGASQGSGIGITPPGGGKGTGSELPGTGGTGLGYGRGSGIGIGRGKGVGVGDGGGTRYGLNRGIPFGDVVGILNGDPNGGGGKGGGPGGPGRGNVFGTRPGETGGGSVHIVYVIDTSGSMREGNKIGKAKEALKKALSELKPKDTFNIINFDFAAHPLADRMVPAIADNIDIAMQFVDELRLRNWTNLSAGLEVAFKMETATHIFVLSDGEPHGGIEDPTELRKWALENNTKKAQIITLALGLGEQFPGIPLLKGLAEDHHGKFSYVNLAKVPENP
jgi:hypothetical protein